MPLNHQDLADAMRERRTELGMSRKEACRLTRRADLEFYFGHERAFPGVSERQWGTLESGEEVEPRAHTLLVVDAALRWPEGTANAILRGLPRPEGEPVFDQRSQDTPAPSRSEFEHARAEIASLRADVADLTDVVSSLRESVYRLTEKFRLSD